MPTRRQAVQFCLCVCSRLLTIPKRAFVINPHCEFRAGGEPFEGPSCNGIIKTRFSRNLWSICVISRPANSERESLAELRRTEMYESTSQRNKALVLEAFETLFNKKDFVAAEKFWSPNYIQHSAHIPPGRDGLFGLVKSGPPEMKYENSLILAEGDMLMLHGRFSGLGLPANWIVVDIVRIENGLLAEHWDVIEDEVTEEKSASSLPMFGARFPS